MALAEQVGVTSMPNAPLLSPPFLQPQNQEPHDLRSRARAANGSNANGRVTGVCYIRHGRQYFPPAKVILPPGYTYQNTRLLLLSRSRAYPNGLRNQHGQVGKHFFAHYQTAATALFPFDVNIWYGLPAQGVTVDDFADDAYDHTGLDFIGGTSLHVRTERHAIEGAEVATYGKATMGQGVEELCS